MEQYNFVFYSNLGPHNISSYHSSYLDLLREYTNKKQLSVPTLRKHCIQNIDTLTNKTLIEKVNKLPKHIKEDIKEEKTINLIDALEYKKNMILKDNDLFYYEDKYLNERLSNKTCVNVIFFRHPESTPNWEKFLSDLAEDIRHGLNLGLSGGDGGPYIDLSELKFNKFLRKNKIEHYNKYRILYCKHEGQYMSNYQTDGKCKCSRPTLHEVLRDQEHNKIRIENMDDRCEKKSIMKIIEEYERDKKRFGYIE